jgi:hypothetical protein
MVVVRMNYGNKETMVKHPTKFYKTLNLFLDFSSFQDSSFSISIAYFHRGCGSLVGPPLGGIAVGPNFGRSMGDAVV